MCHRDGLFVVVLPCLLFVCLLFDLGFSLVLVCFRLLFACLDVGFGLFSFLFFCFFSALALFRCSCPSAFCLHEWMLVCFFILLLLSLLLFDVVVQLHSARSGFSFCLLFLVYFRGGE